MHRGTGTRRFVFGSRSPARSHLVYQYYGLVVHANQKTRPRLTNRQAGHRISGRAATRPRTNLTTFRAPVPGAPDAFPEPVLHPGTGHEPYRPNPGPENRSPVPCSQNPGFSGFRICDTVLPSVNRSPFHGGLHHYSRYIYIRCVGGPYRFTG